MQPGTRYWTILKYLSLLYFAYTIVGVALNWESYRTAIILPALWTLALWKPRPIGWVFLLASLGITTFNYAYPAIHGLGYVGNVQVVGWGTPYDEELLRAQYAIFSVSTLLIAMYLATQKTLFVPVDTRFLWLKGIGAVLLAFVIAGLPKAERILDSRWAHRDLQRYARAFGAKEAPKTESLYSNESQLNRHKAPVADQQATRQGLALTEGQLFRARVIQKLKHSYHVFSVSISPDGKRIATGGLLSNRINIWDVETGKLVHDPTGLLGDVRGLSYSPDGKYLAAGMGFIGASEKDISVYVWDAHTLELKHTLHGPVLEEPNRGGRNNVESLSYSPNGQYLAVAYSPGSTSRSYVIAIYDAKTGQVLKKLPATSNFATPIVFRSDGKALAYGGWREGEPIKMVDVDSGDLVHSFAGHRGIAQTLTIRPDGKHLAISAPLNAIPIPPGQSKASMPPIIYAITIYDAQTQEMIKSIKTDHSARITSIAYSPDGNVLATGAQDKSVKMWDANTGELLGTVRGHPGLIYSISFSSNGDRLIAGGDKFLTVWEISKIK
jgi:tricorn protease-like protein